MTSTNDRVAQARAARLAKTGASMRLSDESLAAISDSRRLSETTAGEMLARARAERGAAPLGDSYRGSPDASYRRGSWASLEGDAIAQADRASLASWSPAPDDAAAAAEGAAGAESQLARAKAARLAREAAAREAARLAQPPAAPLLRQSGAEADTNLETNQAVRANPWELSLNKAVPSEFELASPAAWLSGSDAAVSPEVPEIPNESLLHPALPGAPRVQCLIRRHRSGLGLYPTYRMYLTRRRQGPLQRDGPTKKGEERGEVFLLSARRRSGVVSGGHSFLISRDPTDLEHGPNHVAKLRSNLIGTQWMLYDCGASPAKLEKGTATGSARRELAHIWSQQNIVGREGPRRTRVTLPPLDEKATHLQPHGLAPTSRDESLSRGFKQHKKRVAYPTEEDALAASFHSNSTVSNISGTTNTASDAANRDLFFFDSIEAEVDPYSGRHSLDFEGRALCASVKNFQLESREEPGVVNFLFGKHAKDEYSMDYSYPMSPVQAFALALSALGYKLGNEGG